MVDVRLVTLVTLCEEKSYVKTAKKLFITQPCVTHHIKALEHDYEITLFENRNFELTPKGQLLYDYAKNAIQEFNIIKKCLKDDIKNSNSKVALTNTALECIGVNRLKRTIKESGLVMSVSTYEAQTIFKKLEAGELDFAIIDSSYDSSKFSSIDILTTSIVLISSINGIYGEKDRITREQLINSMLILGDENSALNETILNSLHNKNIRINKDSIVYTNNIELMIDYVNRFDAIGITYYDTAIEHIKNKEVKFVDLLNFHPSHNLYLVYKNDTVLPKEISDLFNKIEARK